MASNKEILGIAAEQGKTVNVQLPDGRFIKMSPSEAAAHKEREGKVDGLTIALRNFMEKKKQAEAELARLALGGSDPGGKETLVKILTNMGRRPLR